MTAKTTDEIAAAAQVNQIASIFDRHDREQAIAALLDERASDKRRIAELEAVLRDVLSTGLNGGNNVRLAFIAASHKELSEHDLAKAEASEQAVNRARATLGNVKRGEGA